MWVHMDKDKAKINEIMTPLLAQAGAALQDCQVLEYGMGLLLLHFSRLGSKGLDPKQMFAIMENTDKKTAGQLLKLMRENLRLSPGIEQALPAALAARNRLIHRVLIDNAEGMYDVEGRTKTISEIKQLRSAVIKANKLLRPFIEGLSGALDGYDAKADRQRNIQKLLTKEADSPNK